MALEEILSSIAESFDARKNHLLAQAEYEAGQIIAQKKASLEEWARKEEALWEEKMAREKEQRRRHIDVMIDQEKKKRLYEEVLEVFSQTMDEVLKELRSKPEDYVRFLAGSVHRAATLWQTDTLTVILAPQDVGLFPRLEESVSEKLSLGPSRHISGGVICSYQQEEIDESFEQIREMMRSEMIPWIYRQIEGEHNG